MMDGEPKSDCLHFNDSLECCVDYTVCTGCVDYYPICCGDCQYCEYAIYDYDNNFDDGRVIGCKRTGGME